MIRDKTILITGANGFVGGALNRELQAAGNEVLGIDNFLTSTEATAKCNIIELDVRDINTDHQLVNKQFDYIFHFGEYSRIAESLKEPALAIDNNLDGCAALMKFIRTQKKAKLIYSGSSTKFDNKFSQNISPYSLSKFLNAKRIRYECPIMKIPYCILYFYNVYGPGEISTGRYSTVVAKFLETKKNNEIAKIHSPGTQRRNFTHIDDIVSGILLAAEFGEGDHFSIGAQEDYSIIELAEMIGVQYQLVPEISGNRLSSSLNIERIKQLGWHQKWTLNDFLNGYEDNN